ncbi:MAG: response regulator transcription factor [Acidibrevibacterium sp.]|uniref:response regulator transcription factor n=1 Tax=Acidibrevibacterium sp. TaxID=2606776 RepID=UPI003D03AC2E
MQAAILLIDDHPIVRDGCRRLLETRPDFTILEAGTGTEGLAMNRRHGPDLIILDLNLPDGNGLEFLRRLHSETPAARVLVFSMYEEAAFVARALEAGARGYLTKHDDPEALLAAVDALLRGERYLGHRVAQKLALLSLQPADDPLRGLTARELDVLDLLGSGAGLADIAAALGLSYRSAAHIAAQLRTKLALRSQAALVKFAVETAPERRARRDDGQRE